MTGLLFPDKYHDAAAEEAAQRRREAEEGERRKAEGQRLAAAPKEHLLGMAREMAFDIARGVLPHADGQKRADGLVTADDVFYQWQRVNRIRERQGHPPIPWIGDAAGHLFRGKNWEAVGLVKSTRVHAHRNLLRQWKWKHNPN